MATLQTSLEEQVQQFQSSLEEKDQNNDALS